MKPEEFRQFLQRPGAQIPAVAFFIGDDEYLRRDLIEEVKSRVLGGTDPMTTVEHWDGEEHSLADVLASADQLAFGGARKVLVIKNAEPMMSQEEILEPYLRNPSPTAVLIFCVEKLDMRRKGAKSIEKLCAVVTIAQQYADQREAEVRRLLGRFGQLRFDEDAWTCLRDWVDDDLGALSKELEKISLAYPDKALIETADIEGLVFRQETQNVFELVDAIVARDPRKALDILVRAMRDDGKSALEIFGLLRSQAEKLYAASEMLDSRQPARTVCQTLRIPLYFCDAFVLKARKVRAIQLSRFFWVLYQCDRAIKTGLWSQEMAAEMLVWKICSR